MARLATYRRSVVTVYVARDYETSAARRRRKKPRGYTKSLQFSRFMILLCLDEISICVLVTLGQDPCPCAFDIVDMVPYTISKLSAKSQFCTIPTADNTDGKVRIEIILLLENNKMLPRKIKTETK